ncbi:hypothetical protein H072_3603 [Dactylellina haptotyla CBS 200.50]|uniref:Major facilitator superfamily (MFS) profile domain-containing protein n=1 Tax=Dactylellina haptotyla (strain CBS 200.50) TaxID=1284197 RepID=S8AHG2_DACHA|nr:hypothetical protein H072_3603 [Dactylellina haptotyla CBS 200.50]
MVSRNENGDTVIDEKSGDLEQVEIVDKGVQHGEFTEAEERRITRSIDKRLILVTGLIFTLSIIDRNNMGNAAVAGMNVELGMNKENNGYSISSLVFFTTYVLFEPPAVIACRKLGPRIFLTAIALCWGIVVIGMGLVHRWHHLLGLRLLLGMFEAGYLPGVAYLLSTWYTRYEMGKRFASFYVIGSVATAFSGILAYGLMHMGGLGGVTSWRWIFIVEGLLTCLVAIGGYMFILPFPDDPNAHKEWRFLNRAQINHVIRKVDADRGDVEAEEFTFGRFFKGGKDLKVYIFGLILLLTSIVAYALSFFLPIIIHEGMGFSVAASQLLVAPPYVVQAGYIFFCGWSGDKYRIRGPIIIVNCVLEIIGILMIGWTKSTASRYIGVFFTLFGAGASIPLTLTYQANNIRGQWKRAFASTIMVSSIALGGIIAALIFRPQDAPGYKPGLYTGLAAAALTILVTAGLIVYFRWANKKADRGEKILEGHADFRYTI